MKICLRLTRSLFLVVVLVLIITQTVPVAAKPNLDGAWKFTGLKFPGGQQTEADARGMIVVHGKYMAFVRASVDRKVWTQDEPKEEQAKKIIAAFQGLAANCGAFDINSTIITLNQVAQANPGSIGTSVKLEFKLEGKKLTLKPTANLDVEFFFEKLP